MQLPGTYISEDRFARIALLNKMAPLVPLPIPTKSFMPPASLNKPALQSALLTLNAVTLPSAGKMYQNQEEVRRRGLDCGIFVQENMPFPPHITSPGHVSFVLFAARSSAI
jgi:hypothetical protein